MRKKDDRCKKLIVALANISSNKLKEDETIKTGRIYGEISLLLFGTIFCCSFLFKTKTY